MDLLLLVAVLLPPKALDILGQVQEEQVVETPFGRVGPLALRVDAAGHRTWVAPYSGLPTRTDPRATLVAAKRLGVQRVLNWDEGVAINPVLGRGQTLLVADYIDFTRHRPVTFFEQEGVVGLEQVPPVCPQMYQALAGMLPGAVGGVYLGVDGPRRETAAEARMFRRWGADVVGQNLVPEISLAAELELCYAGLVTVTQLGADQPPPPPHGEVRHGLEQVLAALPEFLTYLEGPPRCACHRRLEGPRSRGLIRGDWWQLDASKQ